MICPGCEGLGVVANGMRGIDVTSCRDGDAVCDILLVDYQPCPLRCDHGFLVTAAETGGRPSFGLYVREVETLLLKLKKAA